MTPSKEHDTSPWDIHLKEAQEYFRKNEFEKARNLFGQLLEIAPKNLSVLLQYAQSSFAMGDYRNAEMGFKDALKIDESNDAAWYGLALSFYRQGRIDDSIIAFERCLEINPNDRDALMNYGLALHSAGQYEEAIDVYEKILKLNPSDPRVHVNYALSLMAMDRYRDAEGHFRQALAVDEKARTWFELGDVLFRMNEFSGAEDAFRRAIELAPEMEEARERLATLKALGKRVTEETELRDETIEALERERRLVEKEYERITSEKERIVREKERLLMKKAELEEKVARLEESLNIVEEGKEKIAKEREELEKTKKEIEKEWERIHREYSRFEERKKEINSNLEELKRLQESLLEARKELKDNKRNIEQAEQTLRMARENLEKEKEKMDRERAELNRMREELIKERDNVERERREVERLEYSQILKRVKDEKNRMEKEEDREVVERIFPTKSESVEVRDMRENEESSEKTSIEMTHEITEEDRKEKKLESGKEEEKKIGRELDIETIDALLSGKFAGGWVKFEKKQAELTKEVSPEAPLTNHLDAVLKDGKTVKYFECPDCHHMIEITTTKRPLEIRCPQCGSRFRLKGKKPTPPVEKETSEGDIWDEKAILAEKAINLHKSGEVEKALEIYDLMLQMSENDPVIWNNKGVALDSLGRHTQAENCYLKAIQIRKGYTDAWYNLAYSQYKTKQYERAMESLKTLLTLKPDHEGGKTLFERCEEKLRAWKNLFE